MMTTSLKGVSSMEPHRELGMTQKTAWLMSQKIGTKNFDGGWSRERISLITPMDRVVDRQAPGYLPTA